MLLGERGVVGADPPRWREHERRAREVRLHAARAERLLARFEEPPKVRIGSGPGGAEDEALHAVGMVLRDHLPDGAARRVTGDVRGRDAQAVHQAKNVSRHLLHRVADA